MALLYNAPRAATIKAKEKCKLWVLDRETFNHIVKDSVMKKREKFHDFISKVELLDSLTSMEKDKICDCLKTRQYRPGEKVLSEGDDGDCFYILISGKCIATK